jgi:hypothetical protein
MRCSDPYGREMQGASDVKWPMPDAWRIKHWASYFGRAGADATSQYAAWQLFGEKPPAHTGCP